MPPSPLRPFLTRRVILSAFIVGFILGLLFEGFMIGPESRRPIPLDVLTVTLVVVLALVFALWQIEKKRR